MHSYPSSVSVKNVMGMNEVQRWLATCNFALSKKKKKSVNLKQKKYPIYTSYQFTQTTAYKPTFKHNGQMGNSQSMYMNNNTIRQYSNLRPQKRKLITSK